MYVINKFLNRYLYKRIDRFLASLNMQAYSLIFVEIVVGMLVSISSFLFFIKFAKEVLEKDGFFPDILISQIVYAFRTPILTEIMRTISFVGGEVIAVVSVLIVLFLLVKNLKKEAVLF